MNTAAMTIAREQLADAMAERAERKAAEIAERDAKRGAGLALGRVRVTSYMENIGWPGLFGYDMNDYYARPELMLEMQLRQRIFWADNSDDDSAVSFDLGASTGMYFDMTLFGMHITHTRDGVPEFAPHPFAADPRLEILQPWDFCQTGDMPALIAQYRRLGELSREWTGGRMRIAFPCFHRGPLDVLVQLRGYENFLADVAEDPQRVHALLAYFAEARLRYARERQKLLGEASLPPTTFVADDWVNVPFISPRIFREFVVPVYRRIVANEGPVTGFHTCGNFEALVVDLLQAFPDIRRLEVSGWNDVALLDRLLPPEVGFDVAVVNTFVYTASPEDQRARLEAIAAVGRRRPVQLCAQAMVPFPTHAETLAHLNRFLRLAWDVLA